MEIRISERPETFAKTFADRGNERLVWMIGEKLFEYIHFDGSYYREKMHI